MEETKKICQKTPPEELEQIKTTLGQALAFHQQGQLVQAQTHYEEVLQLQADNFDALHLSGVAASQSKNHHKAVALIRKALAVNPDHAEAHSNLGIALRELKQYEAAIASYNEAILRNAKDHNAYYNRGIAYRELKQFDKAVASYDKAIELKPDFAAAYNNRGLALKDQRLFSEALASYDKAIAIQANNADAHNNRGNALRELKRLDEALACFEKVISHRPQQPDAYFNRGTVLQDLQDLDGAIEDFSTVLEMKPDNADARLSKALALLLNGDLPGGFQLYEARWEQAVTAQFKRDFDQPLWLGKESLKNKTILLHGEQGLGDNIQFCRYTQQLAAMGAKVILELPATLMPLLRNLQGVAQFVVQGDALPAFDFHCPLLSLPLACKTSLSTIPLTTAYLYSDAEKRDVWAAKLGEKDKPRVGLVWTGNIEHRNDHNRSLSLAKLLAQLPANCDYISLQKEVRDEDLATLKANPQIQHFGEQINDFSDTAALADLMDVVISVDTSVAHLSGALGKPTWVLLPYAPDWRWLLKRDDNPWYQSVKVYRQDADWNWDKMLKRVAQDLAQLDPAAIAVVAANAAVAQASSSSAAADAVIETKRGLFASLRGALGLGR